MSYPQANNTTMSIIDIWEQVDEYLKDKLGKVSYTTFQKAAKPISFLNNSLILGVPNAFMKKWVYEKCDYHIKRSVKQNFDLDIILELTVNEQMKQKVEDDHLSDEEDAYNQQKSVEEKKERKVFSIEPQESAFMLNPKYTYDTYVVGQSNRFSHAASLAVAKAPGKAYNPYFIYGGVGLGKTHLLHAIGNTIRKKNPSALVRYETTDHFINEFINCIRFDKSDQFRNKYQKIDLCL
ncbi:MAG: DnaA/Hda family protein [Candidatus Riflemargulisbacteria bacterium]